MFMSRLEALFHRKATRVRSVGNLALRKGFVAHRQIV